MRGIAWPKMRLLGRLYSRLFLVLGRGIEVPIDFSSIGDEDKMVEHNSRSIDYKHIRRIK